MRTIDPSDASWRKSSYSNQGGGACVEVSVDFAAVVPVRDSELSHSPALNFPAGGWSSVVAALKDGQLSA
ncbi:DUF397 domain-containing protein [Streptomyces colonosanans]|uniref:DUF397 domain-containing protein n=1 Tax=Streptomyces colonosanans TaxID=1428652 RepID=A0A1S2PQE3_9ACTN|nr:DUF397 domain-containing protein [Streptomyces colonosanans]OIJ96027.1 DUF397 domain-containing protein [Streptomyces colonosanans]